MRMLPALLVLGCARPQSHSSEPIAPLEPAEPLAAAPAIPATPAAEHARSPVAAEPAGAVAGAPYGGLIRSVEFLATTVLRKEPRGDAAKVGIVSKGTLASAVRAAPAGDGCAERWIQVAPRGWACETVLDPSLDAPTPAVEVSLSEPDDVELPVVT